MPKLIAREDFPYKGNPIKAGEEFEAEENDAKILTGCQNPRADYAKQSTVGPMTTQDMTVKDESSPEEEPVKTGEAAAPRRYNRRDMRARS